MKRFFIAPAEVNTRNLIKCVPRRQFAPNSARRNLNQLDIYFADAYKLSNVTNVVIFF